MITFEYGLACCLWKGKTAREQGSFVRRLCKQKFIQGFRRVIVREESEGAKM